MREAAYRVFEEQTASPRRAKGLLLCRFVVIFLFLAAMLLPQHREVFNNRYAGIFGLLVGLTILNCLYYLLTRHIKNLKGLVAVQMVVDLLAISAIAWLSGGENSSFLFLYFASIVAAGIMLSPRSSLLFASFSTISLSAIAIVRFLGAYYDRPLPFLPRPYAGVSPDMSNLFYSLSVHALGFYVVAVLTAALAGRLRRMRDLNRQIVEQFRDGLLVMNGGGRILFANDSAVGLLDFSAKNNLVNRRLNTVFRRETDGDLRDALAAAPPVKREIRFQRGAGSYADLEVATSVLKSGRNKEGGTIAVVRDLTEQKRMEQAARVTEQLKEIQQMSAGLAHEIRNPLASVRGCAQQLGNDDPRSENSRKLLGIICRESDRLDRIIADFLQFARMRRPKKKKCDIAEILGEVADLIEARRRERDFTLQCNFRSGLICRADSEQMVQLFLNLATNAFEAIGNGGTIRLVAHHHPESPPHGERRVDSRPRHIRVFVCDDGEGISPENLGHIFTPFFSTKDNGVGLGLSIVSTIVEQHDMQIEVIDELGGGTRFELLIPASDYPSEAAGERTDVGNESRLVGASPLP